MSGHASQGVETAPCGWRGIAIEPGDLNHKIQFADGRQVSVRFSLIVSAEAATVGCSTSVEQRIKELNLKSWGER